MATIIYQSPTSCLSNCSCIWIPKPEWLIKRLKKKKDDNIIESKGVLKKHQINLKIAWTTNKKATKTTKVGYFRKKETYIEYLRFYFLFSF